MTDYKAIRTFFVVAVILITLISSVIGVSTFWLISTALKTATTNYPW